MYLRETRRRNKDGSTARYLQLAHNYRDPSTGVSRAKIIHNFGRVDSADTEALKRLASSIERFVDSAGSRETASPEREFEIQAYRDVGGAWTLDQVWEQLCLGRAVAAVAADRGLDPDLIERGVFAMVAYRALGAPRRVDLAEWVAERVAIEGITELDSHVAYHAVELLVRSGEQLISAVWSELRDCLEPDQTVFVRTAEASYLNDVGPGSRTSGLIASERDSPFPSSEPVRLVVATATTREGLPIGIWSWPASTPYANVVANVRGDLSERGLDRITWTIGGGEGGDVVRAALAEAGLGYVVAARLRGQEHDVAAARARQGRYHRIDDSLEMKEAWVGDGDLAERFIVCRSREIAEHDSEIRERLIRLIEHEIADSDALEPEDRAALYEQISANSGLDRYLRKTSSGLLRVDKTTIREDAGLDGKFLLRASDALVDSAAIACGYQSLLELERGWRQVDQPDVQLFHTLDDHLRAHVQLCWLALICVREAERRAQRSWTSISAKLNRIAIVGVSAGEGTVIQRNRLSKDQVALFDELGVDPPPVNWTAGGIVAAD